MCRAVQHKTRYETNLLNTAGQAMDFLEAVNHSNAFVHLVSHLPHTHCLACLSQSQGCQLTAGQRLWHRQSHVLTCCLV